MDGNGIPEVLIDAVLAGAAEVLETRVAGTGIGCVGARYKDATELVTDADTRSDIAMRAVFERRLPAIDPSITICLEESGAGADGDDWFLGKWVGADPLDGTVHFACGGTHYCVQAHYASEGVPLVGVICEPEAFVPLSMNGTSMGRLVYAVRGKGAFEEVVRWSSGGAWVRGSAKPVKPQRVAVPARLVGCVPLAAKMTADEQAVVLRILQSGLVGATTGLASAAANILMAIFGGHHFYANFGAGIDLDLMPGQVIAEEAGLVVWGRELAPPVWRVRKQPIVVAPDVETMRRVWKAALSN